MKPVTSKPKVTGPNKVAAWSRKNKETEKGLKKSVTLKPKQKSSNKNQANSKKLKESSLPKKMKIS